MKRYLSRLSLISVITIAALSVVGCATAPRVGSLGSRNSFTFDPPVKQPKNPSNVAVKLSTGAQRLYVVEGNEVLLATPICVGKASSPTPLGSFRINAKVETRRRASSPGAGYPMPYWMEFYTPAYGMHWGFVKPYPSTHGCVRMPLKSAKKVFQLVRVGTPINVARSQPWDDTVGKTLPRLDDSSLRDPPDSYMLGSSAMADIRNGRLWNF
jgi:hypothetical protein